jgi:glyoxylase-like metal-dependent hydrolase (beta-lactamase superfamily II)
VIAGKNGLIFDSGYGRRRTEKSLVHNIQQISALMKDRGQPSTITQAMTSHGHWDHFSGLHHLQKALGVDILATKKQAEKTGSKKEYKKLFWANSEIFNRPTPDFFKAFRGIWDSVTKEFFMALLGIRFVPGPIQIIDENTTLTINKEPWKLIHLPGHCDDDMVLYNQKRGILLSGDIILRSITTWLGPPNSDLKDYIKSLEYLKTLPNLKLILPAHGSPIKNPHIRIQAAIDHRKKRTQDLFQLISTSGKQGIAFENIFKHYYPKSKRIQRSTLSGWIVITLEYLLKKGEITSVPGGRDLIFKTS